MGLHKGHLKHFNISFQLYSYFSCNISPIALPAYVGLNHFRSMFFQSLKKISTIVTNKFWIFYISICIPFLFNWINPNEFEFNPYSREFDFNSSCMQWLPTFSFKWNLMFTKLILFLINWSSLILCNNTKPTSINLHLLYQYFFTFVHIFL